MRQSWARRPSFSEEGRVHVLWLRLEASALPFAVLACVAAKLASVPLLLLLQLQALGISVACNREE